MADLERAGRRIRDPAARVRFLRDAMDRYMSTDDWLDGLPSAGLRRRLYRLLGIERLRHLANASRWARAQLTERKGLVRSLSRAVAVTAGAAAVVAAATWGLTRVPDLPPTTPGPPGSTEAGQVAESLSLAEGVATGRIWLVDQGPDWEQYSNGLRIDSSMTVRAEPRRFRVFDIEKGLLDEVGTRPVGLLFHTTESDIWPLDESFNEKLRDSTHRLLSYLRRKTVYNYLVDRFGRIYRVVDDESRANHAGYSVWQNGNRVFVNLNSSFLAISFESRWEGGRALPITEAQLAAGRSLANWLRHRFEIAPEMCLGHGMVSVNPKKHLIGHHLDWARGFPFEAFGLPDLYQTKPVSISLFGFSYDKTLVATMGEPWPGVRDAQTDFAAQAVAAGLTVEELRLERRAVYDEWLEIVLEDQKQADEHRNAEASTRRKLRTAGG